MLIVYLDTSALLKRYVRELGTDVVDELFTGASKGARLVISTLAGLELRSALIRLARGGTLDKADLAAAFARVRADLPSFTEVLPLDSHLSTEASAYLEKHPLRTLDALHFAIIQRLRARAKVAGDRLLVCSSDKELVAANVTDGIEVLEPQAASSRQLLRSMFQLQP